MLYLTFLFIGLAVITKLTPKEFTDKLQRNNPSFTDKDIESTPWKYLSLAWGAFMIHIVFFTSP